MSKLIYTVGIPGSGKSFATKEIAKKEKAVVLSTDDLRMELFGSHAKQKKTSLLFYELYKRANKHLASGQSVIIDATNIDREKRMKALKKFGYPTAECYYFDTPYDLCLKRNQKRKRNVEESIMIKMRKNLHFPFPNEGWNAVHIIHEPSSYGLTKEDILSFLRHDFSYETLRAFLLKFPFLSEMYGFDQESPYHQFPLCQHTYHVMQYIQEYYEGQDKEKMLLAALFHDSGKPFCKTYKPAKGHYSYFGHEHVSAQLACHFLLEAGFDTSFVCDVVHLIDMHMLINYGGEEGANQIYHLLGAEQLTNLYFFLEADQFAK